MIPVSEIERLIEDYDSRIKSASLLMSQTNDVDQFNRVAGKHEAYIAFMRELKELLPDESSKTINPNRAYGYSEDH